MFISSLPDMNKILSELILGSCVSISLMPDKLLMEHVMLLAILTSHIGTEVGEWNTVSLHWGLCHHCHFCNFWQLGGFQIIQSIKIRVILKADSCVAIQGFLSVPLKFHDSTSLAYFYLLFFTSKRSLGGYIHLSHISTQIFLFLNNVVFSRKDRGGDDLQDVTWTLLVVSTPLLSLLVIETCCREEWFWK